MSLGTFLQGQLYALDRGSAKEEMLDGAINNVLKKQAEATKPGLVQPTAGEAVIEDFDAQPKRTAVFDLDAVELRDRCDSAYTPHVVPFENMSPVSDGRSCQESQKARTSIMCFTLSEHAIWSLASGWLAATLH